jgi:hypothetical protein
MADTKISALPASTTPLAGTEVLPIVQSGVTRQVSVANLTAGRAVSAASVTASTGNFVVGTSGQGIDFSATPGTGTSELLNDYEEGTWTPVLQRNSGTFACTYTTRDATYTKIGRQVTLYANIVIDTISAAGSSDNILQGAPFLPASTTGVGAASLGSVTLTGIKAIQSQSFNFSFVNALGAASNEDYVAGGTLQFTITYFV